MLHKARKKLTVTGVPQETVFLLCRYIFLITIIATANSSLAQVSKNDYSISFLTTEDGLSQGSNRYMLQDSKGYMWISSQDGINRYDGRSFFHFDDPRFYENCKPFKQVFGLIEDKNGDIWLGSGQGIYIYSQSTNTFRKYSLPLHAKDTNKFFMPFAAIKDEVWISDQRMSFKAVNIKNHAVRTLFEAPDSLRQNLSVELIPQVDQNENIWIASNQGIYKISTLRKAIQRFFLFKNKSTGIAGTEVTAISLNAKKQVLGVSTNKGVVLFNTAKENNIDITDPENKIINTGTWNVKATQEYFFVSSMQFGLIRVEADGSRVTSVMDHKVLDNEFHKGTHTLCMYTDKWGRLWLCSEGEYIAVVDFNHSFIKKIVRGEVNGLVQGTVVSAAVTGDKVWVCDGSLAVFDKITGQLEKKYSPLELPGNVSAFYQLYYDSLLQRVWVAGSGKIYYYDLDAKKFVKPGFEFPGNYALMDNVRSFARLKTGELLIATTNGVYQLSDDGKNARFMNVFGNTGIKHLTGLSGHRVGVSQGAQLKIFQMSKDLQAVLKKTIVFNSFPLMINEDSLNRIIWVATDHGVYKVNNTSYKILRHYTTADGMANDFVYAAIPDKFGWTWCSTNKGIVAINSLQDKFLNFDITQNLQDPEFNSRAFTSDNEGYIYFGGVKGLNYFRPPYTDGDTILPRLTVEEINLNNNPIASGINPDDLKQIQYPYGAALLSIKVEALHIKKAAGIRILYRLSGRQSKWSEINNGDYIQMFNLSPGKYILEISFKDALAGTEPAHRILYIHVLPPWYNTWWFYTLLAIVAVAIIWFVVKAYVKQKLEKQRTVLEKQKAIELERMRISTELHDDLGGGLSTIRLISEMMKERSADENIGKQLGKISDSSKELVQKMNEIVWALNVNNDNLQSLLAYIRQYAVKALDDVGINCLVNMPASFPNVSIAGKERRNIFLIVKECINNIVKHSKASQVDIEITWGDNIYIRISDNGIGFSNNATDVHHFGINNLKDRAAALNGNIEWQQHNGTTVIIELPLESISNKSVIS